MEKLHHEKTFRQKIDLLLATENLTSAEIAQKMGVSRQSFTNIKRYERHQPRTIHKLSKAFGVPVDYFME